MSGYCKTCKKHQTDIGGTKYVEKLDKVTDIPVFVLCENKDCPEGGGKER